MNNQPNEMVMLEWLLPLFDQQLSQLSKHWQSGADSEDMADQYHELSGAFVMIDLPFFANTVTKLSSISKDNHDKSVYEQIQFIHQLIQYELTQYAQTGRYDEVLIIESVDNLAQTLIHVDNSDHLEVNQHNYHDIADTDTSFISFATTSESLTAVHYQELLTVWRDQLQNLLAKNDNQLLTLSPLEKVSHYLSQTTTDSEQQLWYSSEIWLHNLAHNAEPLPADYASILIRLEQIIEAYIDKASSSSDSAVNAQDIQSTKILTIDNIQNLQADIDLQLSALIYADNHVIRLLNHLPPADEPRLPFFSRIMLELEAIIYRLNDSHSLLEPLEQIKNQLTLRGWHFYESQVTQILENLNYGLESETIYSQIQWQIEQQLQDLHSQIYQISQSINQEIGRSTSCVLTTEAINLDEPLTNNESQTIAYPLRMVINEIKNHFTDYLEFQQAHLLPSVDMFMEISNALEGIGLLSIQPSIDKLSDLFTQLQAQEVSTISGELTQELANGLSAIELILDRVTEQVFDQPLVVQLNTHIDYAELLIEDLLSLPIDHPDRVNPTVDIEPYADDVDRYDDQGTIAAAVNISYDSSETDTIQSSEPVAVVNQTSLSNNSGEFDEYDTDSEIRNIFIEEAQKIIPNLEDLISIWAQDRQDLTPLMVVMQDCNTLKGSGSMVGAISISEIASVVENLLDYILDKSLDTTDDVVNFLKNSNQHLAILLTDFIAQSPLSVDPTITLLQSHNLLSGNPINEGIAELAEPQEEQIESASEETELFGEALALDFDETESETTENHAPISEDQSLNSDNWQQGNDIQLANLNLPSALDPFIAAMEQLPSDTQDADPDIKEIFIEEADEVLTDIIPLYKQWRKTPEVLAMLTDIRRGFHTLKGSGRMVGAFYTAELAWAIEDMINRVLDQNIEVSIDVVELIGDVLDAYPSLMTIFAQDNESLTENNDYPAIIPLWITCAQAYSKRLENEFSYLELRTQWLELSGATHNDTDDSVVDNGEFDSIESHAVGDDEHIDNVLHNINAVNEIMADAVIVLPTRSTAEQDFFEVFVDEAQILLQTINQFVIDNEFDSEIKVTNDIVRAFHTLRAASGSSALVAISKVSATIEQSLKQLQQHDIMMSNQHLQALKHSTMLIEDYLASYKQKMQQQELTRDINEESEQDLASLQAMLDSNESTLLLDDSVPNVTQLLDIGIDTVLDAEWQLRDALNDADAEEVQSYVQQQREQITRLTAQTSESSKFSLILNALNDAYHYVSQHPKMAASNTIQTLLLSGHNQLIGLFDALAGSTVLEVDTQVVADLQELAIHDASELNINRISANLDVDSKPANHLQLEIIDTDIDLLEIFLEEAQELDEAIAELFSEWHENIDNTDTIKVLQRYLHTIKGGARMADIRSIGDLTHQAESIYEAFVDKRLQPTQQWLSVMQMVQDTLSLQIDYAIRHKESFFATELIAQLQELEYTTVLPTPVTLILPALKEHNKAIDSDVIANQTDIKPVLQPESDAMKNMDSLIEESWPNGLPHPDILSVFLEEANEILISTNKYLKLFLNNKGDISALQALQKDLHNIKGGARMVAADGIADLAHQMEKVYAELASRRSPGTKMIAELLANCHEWLTDSIYVLTHQWNPPTPILLISALEQFSKNPDSLKEVPTESLETQLSTIFSTDRHLLSVQEPIEISEMPSMSGSFAEQEQSGNNEMIRISSSLIERMINLSGESAINRARIDMSMSSLNNSIEDMGTTIQRLADQLRRMEAELEDQILSQIDEELILNEDFDPLEMDQYSSLNQLSKSLTESASDLLDINNTLLEKTRDSENLLLQLSRTQTELQDGLTNSRMVPFARLTPRLERIVRQTANELNKSVELTVLNADDEMDRTILERITSPLEHMLRNAVDHGIEDPQTRVDNGKDRNGHITLEILREGSEIVIHLSDDGRGINVAAVRKKAVAQNLIDVNDTSLSDIDVMQYIFNAGLTTTKKVTQISGRGVGMDVVISEVRQLGGVVSVNSDSGKGSRFTMRVPLTVAVSDALVVRAADRYYAIPLVQIERVVRVNPEKLHQYYQSGNTTMLIDNKDYRVRYLNEILTGNKLNELIVNTNVSLPIIIVKNRIGQNIALQVDQIAGSRIEVVVKPLGRQLSHLEGISAATIMGDGSVMLILDLMALLRSVPTIKHVEQIAGSKIVSASKQVTQQLTILVVDDSVTVRKVTSRLLERQGIIAVVAKDGIDAIEILQELTPDLILLDIEMPRMDGFEVATQIRYNQRLQQIPIIMITSRTGEKHRERAFALGVNDYMGKPFQEDELLANIQKLLGTTISLNHEKS